jgi:hypothetical protein
MWSSAQVIQRNHDPHQFTTLATRGCPIASGRLGCPIANVHLGCPIASARRSCPIANAGPS